MENEQEINKPTIPPAVELALFMSRISIILFMFNAASFFIILSKPVFKWYVSCVCITSTMMIACLFFTQILLKPYRIGPKDNKGDNDDS